MAIALTFLDALVDALGRATTYSKDVQTAPAAILWPDKDHQWEALIPLLRERLPLLTLGPYAHEQRTGPAYWLRCMIARTLPDDVLDADVIPIIYLPGISRQEIRAVEDCPRGLQPLAELQYRGVLWTQKNHRDWTPAAFLQTRDGGLEIEVGAGCATKEALKRALLKLADEPVVGLRDEAPLRAPFFDALLNPDEVRRLLLWMNDPAGYPKRITLEEWTAFCELCRRKYDLHPEKDGPIHAAQALGTKYGNWHLVWQRYEESPHSYPNLPELLRRARPAQLKLFEKSPSWPQDNDEAERELRRQLLQVGQVTSQAARLAISALEEHHAPRREWVWAKLGQSPLAVGLEALTELARETEELPGGETIEAMVVAYTERGWKADAAVLDTLVAVEQADDVEAFKVAIEAVYRSWLDDTACAFQKLVAKSDSEKVGPDALILDVAKGTCILFSDALRFDVGQHLAAALEEQGYDCQVDTQLAALPTVTATSKPAFSPIVALLTGQSSPELTPAVAATQARLTAESFRKLLAAVGYQVLRTYDDVGNHSGKAWTELGAIDSYGHQHGWKIAHHIPGELRTLQNRIEILLEHGWAQVIVITDHGWLMMPNALPKANLPEHLTVLRKGRCARLKDLSQVDQRIVPWFWDPDVRVAVATGIHCYEAGKEYEHGGVSLQECVIPVITVRRGDQTKGVTVLIEQVTWRGLRCHVQISGATPEMVVDVRSRAGDAAASLAVARSPDENGEVSLLVEDEDRIGQAAFVVVLAKNGLLCAQTLTTIGR